MTKSLERLGISRPDTPADVGCCCAANHTGTAVDQVWPAARDDRDRGPGSFGIRVWRAGAEHHDEGTCRRVRVDP